MLGGTPSFHLENDGLVSLFVNWVTYAAIVYWMYMFLVFCCLFHFVSLLYINGLAKFLESCGYVIIPRKVVKIACKYSSGRSNILVLCETATIIQFSRFVQNVYTYESSK